MKPLDPRLEFEHACYYLEKGLALTTRQVAVLELPTTAIRPKNKTVKARLRAAGFKPLMQRRGRSALWAASDVQAYLEGETAAQLGEVA